ncbi:MAG TPA: hypothetical protein VIQ02_04710 [Jiangellaceae bacterium]
MDQIIIDTVAAIGRRDWPAVKVLLHPYLHWTAVDGHTIRGRTKVLDFLAGTPPSDPPVRYELRDGQIYRWIE